MHQLRYEGPRLDDLLARVQADHGSNATILSAEKSRRGGVAGFFAREVFEVVVEVGDKSEAQPEAQPTSPVLLRESDRNPVGFPQQKVSEPVSEPVSGPEPTVLDVREGADEFAELLSSLLADEAPAATPPARGPSIARAPTPPHAEPFHAERHDVGLHPAPPVRLDRPVLADITEHPGGPRPVGTGPVTLDRLFAQAENRVLPAPAIPRRGIVCVVGPKVEVTRTAMSLARGLGQQLDDVVVVPSRTSDQLPPEAIAVFVDELARRQSVADSSTGPLVIAIELVAVLDGYRWVNHVLAMLHPAQIRLAGSARWLLREIDNVRAAVASPAVLDVWETSDIADPQRLLDTGVPVGTVDGVTSTVAMWAAILMATRHSPAPVVVPPAATTRLTVPSSAPGLVGSRPPSANV